MKENVFDVLMYLFENYMDDDANLYSDPESLKVELKEAGFLHSEINKAFDWLESLTQLRGQTQEPMPTQGRSIRMYAPQEMEKLDVTCRGFLLFLEQVGVLDQDTRELVIDRAMALDSDDFDIDQLKWVVLMVLFNQPGREEALTWMEDMVLDELPNNLH
jgi:Smg protein